MLMKKIHGVNVAMIAAVSRNGVIGKDNALPWHIPEDLQYFKENTKGRAVIMGSNTYRSIGRLLPGRKNVVLTRDSNLLRQGSTFQSSLEGAVAEALTASNEVVIIGGGEIYRQFMPYANTLLLTEVDMDVDGDVTFPEFDRNEWFESIGAPKEHEGTTYRFNIYTRGALLG